MWTIHVRTLTFRSQAANETSAASEVPTMVCSPLSPAVLVLETVYAEEFELQAAAAVERFGTPAEREGDEAHWQEELYLARRAWPWLDEFREVREWAQQVLGR